MKTKEEILKMSKEELEDYKWSDDLDNQKENINCYMCSNCYECYKCCLCRNLRDGKKHKYKICNIQLTKKEYEKKLKELEK